MGYTEIIGLSGLKGGHGFKGWVAHTPPRIRQVSPGETKRRYYMEREGREGVK